MNTGFTLIVFNMQSDILDLHKQNETEVEHEIQVTHLSQDNDGVFL